MSDRAVLLRIASSLPNGDPSRRAILKILASKEASSSKVAVSPDTENFVEWVLMTQSAMSPSEVTRLLEQKLGREPEVPVESAPSTRATGPLKEGETVMVDKNKNTNALNTDACEQYDRRVGTVHSVDPEGLVIAFYEGDKDRPSKVLSGDKQFFAGFASGAKTGLYRWTPRDVYIEHAVEKKVQFEVVYKRGGTKVDVTHAQEVEAYVEKGTLSGESRSAMYYTGMVGKFTFNKQGQVYFTLASPQRPNPTTINPTIGDVLYIGVLGKRPGGWQSEAKRLGLIGEND